MSAITVDVDNSSRGKVAVKRNLFGTIDHEQIQEDLKREMKLISEEKKRKWNFDFENFKPLRGRYKWERVHGRLQARRSPTEINAPSLATIEAETAENVFPQRSVNPTGVRTRYNLRMRGDYESKETAKQRKAKSSLVKSRQPKTTHLVKKKRKKPVVK